MQLVSESESRMLESASRRIIGEPFNPWHRTCSFYAPAGQNGTFWYGFDKIAEALGKSVRQVKDDMAILEAKGLIRHTRRRRQSNKYFFHNPSVNSQGNREPAD